MLRVIMGLDKQQRTPCGFAFGEGRLFFFEVEEKERRNEAEKKKKTHFFFDPGNFRKNEKLQKK